MLWKKPANMKYTDMCIFIDKNVPNIVTPGENPELENTIYNYLWLLVKALAIKKYMFTDFQDYDGYAFYAANRLFFALRKNQVNQGKVIKGKLIRPVKSCLNYTKALLYPMKIEYQRETFREVIEEEFVSKKFDAFAYKEHLKEEARVSVGVNRQFENYLKDTIFQCSCNIDNILLKSPFGPDTPEYQNLKISILLTSLYTLKSKKKLNYNPQGTILWHLPKSMSNYVKVLLQEFFTTLKLDIIDCYQSANLSNADLENIITASQEVANNEK